MPERMVSVRILRFAARPESAAALRYGAAVILVAVALGTALILRHGNLPHPFTSFSFTAIAITFWCAGTGPRLLALLLPYLALCDLFVPVKTLGSSFLPCHLRSIWRGRGLGLVLHAAEPNDWTDRGVSTDKITSVLRHLLSAEPVI